MSSSSSSPSPSELPYFCPRCGDKLRFSSVPDLRAHLVSRHTYETLLLLSQARIRSSRPEVLLPLPGPAESQTESSSLVMEAHGASLQLTCLDLTSSSASIQLLRGMFSSSDHVPSSSARFPEEPPTALALPGALESLRQREVGVLEFGLSVGIGLEERLGLGLDRKIALTFAEVEERVNLGVGRLRAELQCREAELERERLEGERLRSEKQEVEKRAKYLSRQVSVAVELTERLKKDLQEKEKELNERQQEMKDVERFLSAMAKKEAEAKSRLQVFIESLLERADQAERQLFQLSSHTHRSFYDKYTYADSYAPTEEYLPARSLDSSASDVVTDRMEGTISYRRSVSVSGSLREKDLLYDQHHYGSLTGRMRTWSLGSGGCSSAGALVHVHPPHCPPAWTQREREGREDARETFWAGQGGCGRTCSNKNHRHHSTEEEDEEEEEEEEGGWSSSEMRRFIFTRTQTLGSDVPSSRRSPLSCCHGERWLGADTLRLRAGLFCVFPYLDVRSLLRAAEVCSDWRFVARHPAVWTRLQLENARVSAEFLSTLSQWCTQTQTVVLKNLRPRSRRVNETREDYHKNTRGSMEAGVEALLRSAGGSLLHLSVSQCPHILTDRTLWLASCYCRNLQTLTYSQQPMRFGNRCLQTIGRCWPHLRSLSVGGAGCGTQGLVAVVRACANLQVLELERITNLSLQVATELCEVGLKSLQTLILTHTPVSGQAILHFHSMCANIRSIMVEVSVSDYFEEPDSPEAQRLFGEILSTLKVIQKRPGLCDVLRVKAEGFC